jgi:ribose transport system permease protein
MVWGPVLALAALIVVGALMNSDFLGYANITNVLARSAFIGIIAVGMTIVIASGGLDLSVGSMAAFVAGLMILVINAALPALGVGIPVILLGMLTAIVAGVIAGFINGVLITKLGIEAFIVTLGSMGIYRSLVTWLADGGTLSLDFSQRALNRQVYYDGILDIAWPIIVFAVVAFIGEIAMRRSRFEPPPVCRSLQSRYGWSLWKKVTEQADFRPRFAPARFG